MASAPAMSREELGDGIAALRTWVEARNFAGYDPYDALNSRFIRTLTFGRKFPRIVALQALRRLPVNLRPLLGIRPEHNPKGLGLFLWSYVRLARAGADAQANGMVEHLVDLLDKSRSNSCSGNGWGYNFDWQNRVFYIPKGTPTIVNSAFIGHALLDAWEFCGSHRARELALPIAEFLAQDLKRLDGERGFCFSYTPIDTYCVHNANALGASLLIRLARMTDDLELARLAHESLAYTVHHQQPDGSWFYAEREGSRWVDSFHTGFVLQAIHTFLEAGEGEAYREAFDRGVEFYAQRFFLDDGTPKYYADRVYPVDIHSPAQALAFFPLLGERYAPLSWRIARWLFDNMRDQRGFFHFRRHRLAANRIPYMRWGQAWAMHGLTTLLLHSKEAGIR